MSDLLPNFLHIGPSKSGSTWLHEVLIGHPEVYLSQAKDLYFFNRYYDRGPGWYRAQFRSASFSLPDARPEVQQARLAAGRVWEKVQEEDNSLTESVQRGLEGSSYKYGYLAPAEAGVRAFRDWIQARLPLARQVERP